MPHVRWQVAVITLPLCTGNEVIPAYSAMTKQSLLLFIFYSGIGRFQVLWEWWSEGAEFKTAKTLNYANAGRLHKQQFFVKDNRKVMHWWVSHNL